MQVWLIDELHVDVVILSLNFFFDLFKFLSRSCVKLMFVEAKWWNHFFVLIPIYLGPVGLAVEH